MLFPGRVKLKAGDDAPDFTLPDQDGNDLQLQGVLEDGPVVLFFYPKDNTMICTAEACAFRDSHEVFAEAGAQVIGISRDSVDSHRRFHDKHGLQYRLVSDKDGAVHKMFGVRSGSDLPKVGWAGNDRVTFVIDRDSRVRHVHAGLLESQGHVDDALSIVQELTV